MIIHVVLGIAFSFAPVIVVAMLTIKDREF